MFKLVKSETAPLTPQLAQSFRDMNPSPTERDFDPKRAKYLREKLLNGLAIPFNWVTAELDGTRYRMNGQHSSTLLCQMAEAGEFPPDLVVNFSEYHVDSELYLAMLFRQFDDRRSARTIRDISGAYQGLFAELKGIPKSTAKRGIEGYIWHARNIEGLAVESQDDQYKLFGMSGLHGFLRWLPSVCGTTTPEFHAASIVAAMYATFIVSEEDSSTFWGSVGEGGPEYDPTAPEAALADGLKARREGRLPGKKPAELYWGCLYAWNAMRAGKAIRAIKWEVPRNTTPRARPAVRVPEQLAAE